MAMLGYYSDMVAERTPQRMEETRDGHGSLVIGILGDDNGAGMEEEPEVTTNLGRKDPVSYLATLPSVKSTKVGAKEIEVPEVQNEVLLSHPTNLEPEPQGICVPTFNMVGDEEVTMDMLMAMLVRMDRKMDSVLRVSRNSSVKMRKQVVEAPKIIEPESLEQAADEHSWISGVVKSWRQDKGFGFVRASDGREVFAHASSVEEGVEGIVNRVVMMTVIKDVARGPRSFRAACVRREERHLEVMAKEQAARLAEDTVRAAQKTRLAIELAEEATDRAKWNKTSLIVPPGLGQAQEHVLLDSQTSCQEVALSGQRLQTDEKLLEVPDVAAPHVSVRTDAVGDKLMESGDATFASTQKAGCATKTMAGEREREVHCASVKGGRHSHDADADDMPEDAPKGHEAYAKCSGKLTMGSVFFECWSRECGMVRMFVDASRCGSEKMARRLARSCYVKVKQDWTALKVEAYRDQWYAKLKPEASKGTTESSLAVSPFTVTSSGGGVFRSSAASTTSPFANVSFTSRGALSSGGGLFGSSSVGATTNTPFASSASTSSPVSAVPATSTHISASASTSSYFGTNASTISPLAVANSGGGLPFGSWIAASSEGALFRSSSTSTTNLFANTGGGMFSASVSRSPFASIGSGLFGSPSSSSGIFGPTSVGGASGSASSAVKTLSSPFASTSDGLLGSSSTATCKPEITPVPDSGDEDEEENEEKMVAVLERASAVEQGLNDKAKVSLTEIPLGKAAELLDRAGGSRIKDPSKYVQAGAIRIAKELSTERRRDDVQQHGHADGGAGDVWPSDDDHNDDKRWQAAEGNGGQDETWHAGEDHEHEEEWIDGDGDTQHQHGDEYVDGDAHWEHDGEGDDNWGNGDDDGRNHSGDYDEGAWDSHGHNDSQW